MRTQTRLLANGDEIDKHLSEIMGKFCQSSLTLRSFDSVVKENQAEDKKEAELAQYFESLQIEMVTYLPIIKLEAGKYLIGSQ